MELSGLKQETQTSLWASKEGDYMPSMDMSFTRYEEEFTEFATETAEHTTDYDGDVSEKKGEGRVVGESKGPGVVSQVVSAMAPC